MFNFQRVQIKIQKNRKRTKTPVPEIEIKTTPHQPRKSAPTEYTTDEEDMIMYDVEEDDLEPNPVDKFAKKEYYRDNPDQYLRAVTPTRFRKSRN
ncbi:hypothetical protein TNCV_490501 [Trichonephila clavipes]|nr:hypothetical protein TNCV_490501 [Trichonephila clavipes]